MIDLEATMSQVLRTDGDVTALVADRVWLSAPSSPSFPAVMIRRIGGLGEQAFQGDLLNDAATVDVHCYGGSRVETLRLAQTVLDVLCKATDRLTVKVIGMQRIPDPTMPQESGRDRERYIATVSAFGH